MASTLGEVIDFYSVRFNNSRAEKEESSLVAFLKAL